MTLARSWCFIFSLLMGLSLNADVVDANKAHQMLSDKTNQERNEALTVLLIQSKEDCDAVMRNFFQGNKKNCESSNDTQKKRLLLILTRGEP